MLQFLKNKITFIAPILVCGGILFWAYGCKSTTKSILIPQRKVTRPELELELETIIGMYNLRIDDLQKKQELQQWFFEQAASFAQTGTINPIGVLTSLLSIIGMGAAIDDVKIRKKLKRANIAKNPDTENS